MRTSGGEDPSGANQGQGTVCWLTIQTNFGTLQGFEHEV